MPEALEDSRAAEHPGRFLAAVVDGLDLDALGFRPVQPAVTGRPPDHPGDLRKRYLYGDMSRIRSSRRLAQETYRQVELLGLRRPWPPDFNTIADFRNANSNAFKQGLRAFTVLCQQWGLFGAEWVAIDGSPCKAVNNPQRHVTHAKWRDLLQALEAKLAQYRHPLDAADATAVAVPALPATARREPLPHRRERPGRAAQLRAALAASGASQIALTAPDRRARPTSPTVEVGDHGQTAVDAKPTRIMEPHVTQAVTDVAQLRALAMPTQALLGVEHLQVVADRGDDHGEAITTCAEAGIEPSSPKPWTSAHRQLGLYGTARFTYAPEPAGDQCPAGQRLTCRVAPVERGRPLRAEATTAGRPCAIQAHCTRHQEGRRRRRWVHAPMLARMHTRVEANPGVRKRRKPIVEHPFRTITHWNDQGYFLRRGVEKGRAERRLSALADHRTRVLHILGVPAMSAAVA